MKKVVAFVVVLTLAFSLIACSSKKDSNSKDDASNTNSSSQSNTESNKSTETTTESTTVVEEQKEEPVSLRFSWWGGDARHEATLKAIETYEAAHPNVTIEPEYSSYSGYYEKLVTQISSGNAPDFFQVDQGWVAELYARGDAFADMSSMNIDFSTFADSMKSDYCTLNNELVVLPFGYNGTVFLYNKTLLEDWCDENGELKMNSWNDFIQIGKELHAKDPEAYMTTSVTDGYLRYMLKPMLEQYTNSIDVQDDFTLGFEKEDMEKAFNSFMEIFNNGASQPYEEALLYDSMQNNPLWLNGKIGGIFLFFSNIDTEIAGLNYDYGVAGMPMFEDATLSGQECCPSLMVAINKKVGAKQQEAAAEFLDWFLNSEEASLILGTVRGVPASSTALDALTRNNVLSELMAKGIQISNDTLSLKNGAYELNASVKAVFVDYMEKVIYKVLTPAEASSAMYDDLLNVLVELSKK